MPFKSEKQRRFLWMHEPEVAKRWTKEHGSKPRKKAVERRMKRVNEHSKGSASQA